MMAVCPCISTIELLTRARDSALILHSWTNLQRCYFTNSHPPNETKTPGGEAVSRRKRRNNSSVLQPVHPISGHHSRYTTFVYRPSHLPTILLVNLRSDFKLQLFPPRTPTVYFTHLRFSGAELYDCTERTLAVMRDLDTTAQQYCMLSGILVLWIYLGIFHYLYMNRGHISLKHSGV
jgi:hypothetical protein